MHEYLSIGLLSVIVLLLIARFIKKRRDRNALPEQYQSRVGSLRVNNFDDDGIIAVRKRERIMPTISQPASASNQEVKPAVTNVQPTQATKSPRISTDPTRLLVLYVMAKPAKQFAGYELLQSLLTAGMRFGEMNIFHRHHELSGTGTLLFSLASATEPGTFDIHNMGTFAGKGLTLFMQCSNDPTIDIERYELMLKTAQQLAEDLDGILLDERRELLNADKIIAKKRELTGVQASQAVYS